MPERSGIEQARPENTGSDDQLDLFERVAQESLPRAGDQAAPGNGQVAHAPEPIRLDNHDLLERLEGCDAPGVPAAARVAVIREVGRRRLAAAVPQLLLTIQLLSTFDAARPAPEVVESIGALQAIGSHTAGAALGRLLMRGGYAPASWYAALDYFRSAGVPARPELLERALGLGDARVAALAARLAGTGSSPRSAGLLRRLLDSPHPELRLGAAIGLGQMGDRSVKARLEAALQEATSSLDAELLDALARIGDRETVVLIRRLLERAPWPDELAPALLEAAAMIGGPVAQALLEAFARTAPSLAVRGVATRLLAELD